MEKTSKDWVPVGGSGRVMVKNCKLFEFLQEAKKDDNKNTSDLAKCLEAFWFKVLPKMNRMQHGKD